ncbi:MAG: tRNA lysidine(34) synthetase TilS [Actinobacteria bacterium]|nr:tRNA lysidine(34) synthetase TilS [Actinomycetota bacterium]
MIEISSNLKEKVLLTIEKYNMLKSNDKVLVAVSGGPDSLTLLHLLLQIKPEYNLDLHIFHLDHMMRGEHSRKDAAFVKDTANRFQIASTILSFDVPSFIKKKHFSKQEGARKIRYQLLEEVADKTGSDKIALGHTLDDQVETVLMRLIRGSGLEGLKGIPPVRDKYIRPLIEITRKEVEEYCVQNNIVPVIDSSNFSMEYLRNRLRNDLIPYIAENYNPDFKNVVSDTAKILTDDYYVLQEIVLDRLNQIANFDENVVRIKLEDFDMLSLSMKRNVLRESIRFIKGDLDSIEFKHLEMIVQSVDNSNMSLDLPCNLNIYREYKDIVIAKKESAKIQPEKIILIIPGITKFSHLGIEVIASLKKINEIKSFNEKTKAYLDADTLGFPLVARMRYDGDRFIPLGSGGTKKLQDFLVDEKIPKRKRDKIVIVESNQCVVWVGGLRIDDRFKITDKTNNVLILELRESKR